MTELGADVQVTCKFVTNLPAKYRVPEAPITVPANLTRLGLSQIINTLLAFDKPTPFDFLIHGDLLRSTLARLLSDKQLSTEAILTVEYIPAFVPPQPGHVRPHLDWVGGVAAAGEGSGACVATASYDGILRLFPSDPRSEATEPLFQAAAHAGPATSLAAAGAYLVSGGKDRVARLWHVVGGAKKGAVTGCTPVAVLRGHEDSVQCVAVSGNAARCATGGWDGSVRVWRFGEEAREEAASTSAPEAASAKKKRKGATGAAEDSTPRDLPSLAPLATLTAAAPGHSVAGLSFADQSTLYTASSDHTVRQWDLGRGGAAATCTDTLNTARAVHCVAVCPTSGGGGGRLVAFGGAERAVRIWDPRAKGPEGQISVVNLSSHKEWVSAVSWRPGSEHVLASASYDGTVKVWDTRASVPLATLDSHVSDTSDKALCVAWLGTAVIASGGSDCKLRLHAADGELAGSGH